MPASAPELARVEVEVARAPTKSGADGVGLCTFTAEKGGDHRLRVEVTDGETTWHRTVLSAHAYKSGGSMEAHFGLGERQSVDSLEVRWPVTGETQRWENVAADRIVELFEQRADVAESPRAYPLPPARGAIRFDRVSFAYEKGVWRMRRLGVVKLGRNWHYGHEDGQPGSPVFFGKVKSVIHRP